MYSVNLKLKVEVNSFEELKNKLMELNKNGIIVENWQYSELEDGALLMANSHIGKVVRVKNKKDTELGVITKVNPKALVVSVGNGIEYNCPIEGLMDVTADEFKEEDLKIGGPGNFYTYSGFIGRILKDNSLAICFKNRDKYDIILIDTNSGNGGRSFKGILEKDVERYIKFTK